MLRLTGIVVGGTLFLKFSRERSNSMKKKSIYADEIIVVAENQYGEELCTLVPVDKYYCFTQWICDFPFAPGDTIKIKAYDADYNEVNPYDIGY